MEGENRTPENNNDDSSKVAGALLMEEEDKTERDMEDEVSTDSNGETVMREESRSNEDRENGIFLKGEAEQGKNDKTVGEKDTNPNNSVVRKKKKKVVGLKKRTTSLRHNHIGAKSVEKMKKRRKRLGPYWKNQELGQDSSSRTVSSDMERGDEYGSKVIREEKMARGSE